MEVYLDHWRTRACLSWFLGLLFWDPQQRERNGFQESFSVIVMNSFLLFLYPLFAYQDESSQKDLVGRLQISVCENLNWQLVMWSNRTLELDTCGEKYFTTIKTQTLKVFINRGGRIVYKSLAVWRDAILKSKIKAFNSDAVIQIHSVLAHIRGEGFSFHLVYFLIVSNS